MERTELVEKFDTETGCSLERARKTGKVALLKAEYIKWLEAQIPTGDKIAVSAEYLRGLEEKAEAYDRLMGGGNKTLKEWANVLNMIVTLNFDGNLEIWEKVPTFQAGTWCGDGYVGVLASDCWDYTGDWKDSLTLPDGWEEERMIAEHEHGMNMYDANGMP